MNTRVPAAVRNAAKRAEELHTEAYPAPQADLQPTDTQPDVNSDPPKQEQAPQGQPQDQAPPAVDPGTNWEHRFKTLQGKYNAEVPALNQQVRELNQQIARMHEQIESISAAQIAPTQKQTTSPLVSEAEIEEHGEEFVDFLRRVARDESQRAVADVRPEIEEIKGRVKQTGQASAAQAVYAKLDREVEDWREINVSQDFILWLSEEDAFSGTTRKQLMLDAFGRGDANRVATFFKGFKQQSNLINPPTPAAAKPAPAKDLASLAGPGRGSGTQNQPRQQPASPSFTRAQIAEFYADVQRGVYRNKPEEKLRIEAQIGRALKSGAVQ